MLAKFFTGMATHYDLPTGATHLAKSRACTNQAFSVGDQILALQFHLETTRNAAQALIDHCGHEIVDAPYIQPAREILAKINTGLNASISSWQKVSTCCYQIKKATIKVASCLFHRSNHTLASLRSRASSAQPENAICLG